MTAITMPHLMRIRPHLRQELFLPEPLHNRLTRLKTIHPQQKLRILAAVLPPILIADRPVRRHHINHVQPMPLPDLPVVRIMRRRHLQKPRRKTRLLVLALRVRQHHVLIRHNRYLPPGDRQPHLLAHQRRRPRITRMHRHRRITQHRLWPRRRHGDVLNYRVAGILPAFCVAGILPAFCVAGILPAEVFYSPLPWPLNQPTFFCVRSHIIDLMPIILLIAYQVIVVLLHPNLSCPIEHAIDGLSRE